MKLTHTTKVKGLFKQLTPNWRGDKRDAMESVIKYLLWQRYDCQEKNAYINTKVTSAKLLKMQQNTDAENKRWLTEKCKVQYFLYSLYVYIWC